METFEWLNKMAESRESAAHFGPDGEWRRLPRANVAPYLVALISRVDVGVTCESRMTSQTEVSVSRCEYGEVRVDAVSLVQGEPLAVHVSWPVGELHGVVLLIDDHEDQWVLSGPLAWDSSTPGIGRLNAVGERPPGLYKLAAVYQPSRQRVAAQKPLMPPILFEVRAASDSPRTADELAVARDAIVQDRNQRYELGIGEGPVTASVVVFVKDLLMTTRINLGAWEIIPIGHVGWSAELQVVERELRALGVFIQPGSDLIRQASDTEPAVLVKFPRVRGESLDACGNRALYEVDLLLPILAAHRGSRGETFFVFVLGQGETRYKITAPQYRGNLMGGIVSGEEPEFIRRNLAAVRKHPNLRLFVSLLGEAVREEEPDFRYVRLWSLLETMAQAKGHGKTPVQLAWNGAAKLDPQGKPVMVKGAKASVLRLLSATLGSHGQGTPKRTYELPEVRYSSLVERLGIWYRRRNCVAHGDPGCICRDPLKKTSSDEFKVCFDARLDDKQGHDWYLWSLEQMTKDVVFRMPR